MSENQEHPVTTFEKIVVNPVTGEKVVFKADSMEAIEAEIENRFGAEQSNIIKCLCAKGAGGVFMTTVENKATKYDVPFFEWDKEKQEWVFDPVVSES